MKLLNVGCGRRLHMDWVNLDVNPSSPEVHKYNVLEGIPFPGETFDVVYHSHVLEHFAKNKALIFMKHCFRVLKPGGIIRVVVPDLEKMCCFYLEALEKVERGNLDWRSKYDWIMLEMYDQAVRTETGGEMAKYLRQPNLSDKEFIIGRIGSVGRNIIESVRTLGSKVQATDNGSTRERWIDKITRVPGRLRRLIISTVLNENEMKALNLGLFRLKGEVHQWMYDNYSLRRLLQDAGFTEICECSAAESRIQNWNTYFLDIDGDGFVHAPSSFYMEGVKPK